VNATGSSGEDGDQRIPGYRSLFAVDLEASTSHLSSDRKQMHRELEAAIHRSMEEQLRQIAYQPWYERTVRLLLGTAEDFLVAADLAALFASRALTRFSVRGLTGLAALLAGRRRPGLREEWLAHLGGEHGHDPLTWRKVMQALGFVASAIQFRLADAADLAWQPADAVLGSRTLSNLFVWGPVIATLFAIVHHDGRFGLVADDQDPIALGAFLYVVIKTGRWWRGVKPPEPKPRRAKE
jgi:hypothetical protein